MEIEDLNVNNKIDNFCDTLDDKQVLSDTLDDKELNSNLLDNISKTIMEMTSILIIHQLLILLTLT